MCLISSGARRARVGCAMALIGPRMPLAHAFGLFWMDIRSLPVLRPAFGVFAHARELTFRQALHLKLEPAPLAGVDFDRAHHFSHGWWKSVSLVHDRLLRTVSSCPSYYTTDR